MLEKNIDSEVLENDSLIQNEPVSNSINIQVDENNVLDNDDDVIAFTPVVSDGIFEEESLDFTMINDLEDNNKVEQVDILEDNSDELLEVNEEVKIEEDKDIQEDFTELDEIGDEINKKVVSDNSELAKEDSSSNQEEINVENLESSEESDFTNLDSEVIENETIVQVDDNNINNSTETTLLEKYGENFSKKEYVCNPAIGRDNEIKQLILTLLTPEKSGILVGKPGIGKTAIVEGLGYQIQKGNVPDALKEYQIHKLNTSSLLGIMPGTNEPKIQVLLNEIKGKDKLILFIDEIHTLIGAGAEGGDSLDFANIFKPGLDRGNIKIIGATTSDEYDKYILTDKAFVRRFQKIEVLEPTKEHTVKIMMGSLPKLEHKTGAKLKYTPFIQEKIMSFIVDLTTEYRRVYELSARYPDVSLTILQQAFSYAVFDNKKEVSIRDIRKAIYNTKLVYPDVVTKELVRFNEIFSDIYLMETPQRLKGETSI